MSARIVMAAMLAVTVVGCGEPQYQRTALSKLAGDVESEVDPGHLFVPRGGVLMFEAKAVATDDSREYEGWETLELSSTETGVAEVRPAIVRDAWVLNGKHEGSGTIRVVVNGEQVDTIDFDVEEVSQ